MSSQHDHGLWETRKHSRVHGATLPGLLFSDKLTLFGGNMLKLSSSRANSFQSVWTLFPLLPDRDCPFVVSSVYQSPRPNFPNPDRRGRWIKIPHVGLGFKISTSKTREVETQILPNIMAFHIQILFRQHVQFVISTSTLANFTRFPPLGNHMRCRPLKASQPSGPPPVTCSLVKSSYSHF